MIEVRAVNEPTEITTVDNKETLPADADILSILAYRLGIPRYELATVIDDIEAVLLTKRDHRFLQDSLGIVATSTIRNVIDAMTR